MDNIYEISNKEIYNLYSKHICIDKN